MTTETNAVINYTTDFVRRLLEIVARVEDEGMPLDNDNELGDSFTMDPDTVNQLAELHYKHRDAHIAILEYVAKTYAWGRLDDLDDDRLIGLVREVQGLIDNWDEQTSDGPVSVRTDLQKLLSLHHAMVEELVDVFYEHCPIGEV